MTINRYRANSLKSAIDKATAEMGPDAKILSVRKLNAFSSGDNGHKQKNSEIIEIVAVVGDDPETKDEKGGDDIFNDNNKRKRLKSVNMIVNDDLNFSDLADFKGLEELLPKKSIKNNVHMPTKSDGVQSKNPTPLSEVLKAYYNKPYPERRMEG